MLPPHHGYLRVLHRWNAIILLAENVMILRDDFALC